METHWPQRGHIGLQGKKEQYKSDNEPSTDKILPKLHLGE